MAEAERETLAAHTQEEADETHTEADSGVADVVDKQRVEGMEKTFAGKDTLLMAEETDILLVVEDTDM